MITTIGKLFNIVYGQKEYHNKEWLDGDNGKNILISSKGVDNGVYGFFDIPNKFKAPIITVQGYGTIGQAFVQEYDCSVDDHMLILMPKKKMTLEELFQVAHQIRLTKWKYRYGRGITQGRLENEKIKIIKSKINYSNFLKKNIPSNKKREKIKSNGRTKLVPLVDLCEIKREYYYYVDEVDRTKEKIPYITTTESDNGVGVFCNEEPIFEEKTLTVSLDGKSGLTFYQINSFIAGEKTAVLKLKDIKNRGVLIYIGAIIRLFSWRYNYARKLSIGRLRKILIPIPIKEDNSYDLDYIDKLVKNCYGFDKIKTHI